MAVATKAASSHTAVTTGWTNPGNAFASVGDNVYATAAPAKNATVNGDFGFAFSLADFGVSDASRVAISQIVVTVEWKLSNAAVGGVLGVQLRNGGTALGAETTDTTSTADTQRTQTIVSSLPTAADLIAGNLKARIRDTRAASNTAHTGSLDFVKVDVTYTVLPPAITPAAASASSDIVAANPTAFPYSTAVVEDFTDVSDWTVLVGAGVQASGGQAVNTSGSAVQSKFDGVAVDGDYDAYITHIANSGNQELNVFNGSNLGWQAIWDGATYILRRWNGGGSSTVLSSGSLSVASGDKIGLSVRGDRVTMWKWVSSSSTWIVVASGIDGTYSNQTGQKVLVTMGNGTVLDDLVFVNVPGALTVTAGGGSVDPIVGGAATATSAVTASVVRTRGLSASINATSAVTASVRRVRPVAASASSTSNVTASLVRIRALPASATATSAVTASIIKLPRPITGGSASASSSVVASIARVRRLVASATSTSLVSASLARVRRIAGSATSSSAVVASVNVRRALFASAAATSFVTAAIARVRRLTASISATSFVSATITRLHPVTGASATATSNVTAYVSAPRRLTGASASSTSFVSATLIKQGSKLFTGISASASSNVTAAVVRLRRFVASATATSSVTASLSRVAPKVLTASATATSAVTASVRSVTPTQFTASAIATSSVTASVVILSTAVVQAPTLESVVKTGVSTGDVTKPSLGVTITPSGKPSLESVRKVQQ